LGGWYYGCEGAAPKTGTKVVLAEQAEPVGFYAREAFNKMAGHGYPPNYADAIERSRLERDE
jgi:hypothetical protein